MTRLLLALALPVYFLGLGVNSIWDANEAFYVETPRQMVLTGDYLRPMFNGLERFNKPVLSYWIVAGLYNAFGVSVTVERVGIALGAMGILIAAYVIGRALRSPSTGVLAALLVATAPRVVFLARRIFIDVYITMFMALTLAFFVLAERHPERRRLFLTLMYIAIGLGVLTKGPVALVLPAAAFGLWLLVERRLGDIRRLMLVPGALIVLIIVAPWYVWIGLYEQHGWREVTDFFIGENLGRFSNTMTTARGPLFFLGVLFFDLLAPWAPLLAAVLLSEWTRRRDKSINEGRPLRRLLWIWIAVIVGAFSFSASKEDLYIFAVVPAAAVLISDALLRSRFGLDDRTLRVGLTAIAIGLGISGVLVYQYLTSGYYALASAPLVATVLVGIGVLAAVLVEFKRPAIALMTMVAGCVVLNYLIVVRILPDTERLKPVPAFAQTIRTKGTPAAEVAFNGIVLPSLTYYAGQPITELDGNKHAEQFFAQYPEPWVLMSEESFQTLQARVPGLCIADRRHIFETRLADIRRGIPPPEVVLVTKCKSPR